jgi:hypothetical protein
LVKPIVANETFSHVVFFYGQTNDLVKAQTMILAAQSKSRQQKSRVRKLGQVETRLFPPYLGREGAFFLEWKEASRRE